MCIHVHVHVHVHVHACAHEGRCLRWAAPLACPIRATGLACLIWAMGLCCGFGPPVYMHMYMMHVHSRMGTCVCVCVCVLSFCCCCVASWASPKHDLRGSACSCACVCTARAASTSFTIWEVACCTWYVCVCVSRTERSLPVPLVWDGGRAMEEGVGVAPPRLRSARR